MSFFVSFWVNLDRVVRYFVVLQMLGAPKSGYTSHTTPISKPGWEWEVYGNGGPPVGSPWDIARVVSIPKKNLLLEWWMFDFCTGSVSDEGTSLERDQSDSTSKQPRTRI